jgi:hypothetical protein
MSDPVFRRIALTASILALMNAVAVLAIVFFKWTGSSGAVSAIVATGVMILTLGLQIVFVAVQAFRNGRRPIAIRGMGYDAWYAVLVMTAIPGAVWNVLASVALPPMQLIMPNVVTPLFNVLLLLIVRELQQHRSTGVPV